MSLTYRTITSALTPTPRKPAARRSRHEVEAAHDLGMTGRITCSPWEGMYLDQAQPWSAEDEAGLPSGDDLERILAQILSGE